MTFDFQNFYFKNSIYFKKTEEKKSNTEMNLEENSNNTENLDSHPSSSFSYSLHEHKGINNDSILMENGVLKASFFEISESIYKNNFIYDKFNEITSFFGINKSCKNLRNINEDQEKKVNELKEKVLKINNQTKNIYSSFSNMMLEQIEEEAKDFLFLSQNFNYLKDYPFSDKNTSQEINEYHKKFFNIRKEIKMMKVGYEKINESIESTIQCLDGALELFSHYDSIILIKEKILQSQKTTNNLTKIEQDRLLDEEKIIDYIKGEFENKIITKIENIREMLSIKRGQLYEKANYLHRLKNEFSNKNYSNIEQKYNNAKLKYIMTIEVIRTIEDYYEKLDKTLIKYHARRMEEINKLINYYWCMTYKGKDIKSIEIKSDLDKTSSRSRSYNYRIILVTEE